MIGIFGGSFDPIHFGHIKLALALLEHYDFNQIRFIPCQQSPLKEIPHANAQQRLDMLNLVTNSNEKLIVDDRELKRQGPSYTIDTLKELREVTGSNIPLVLIVGVDAFLNFCKWHRFDEILSLSHIMLLQRPEYALPDHGCEKELFDTFITDDINNITSILNGNIYLCEEEKFEISSIAIRKGISEGEQPRYLLPGNVWSYIRRNKLYNYKN